MPSRKDTRYIETRTLGSGAKRYRADIPASRLPVRTKSTWFDNEDLAIAWRDKTLREAEEGLAGLAPTKTLQEVTDAFFAAADQGVVRNRFKEPYKASVLRGYQDAMIRVMIPRLGAGTHIGAISTTRVQEVADELLAELSPSTVRNMVTALRVVLRYALRRGWIRVNPCAGVELANSEKARDRIVTVAEATTIIDAIGDLLGQLIYALAFFTGMRKGELQALRWEDVDLANRVIHVRRSFDSGITRENVGKAVLLGWPDRIKGGFIPPKSKAGVRDIPISQLLMPYLLKQTRTEGLVCGSAANVPFGDHGPIKSARGSMVNRGIEPLTLHEARHTFATHAIYAMALANQFNPKVLQTVLGHASITQTYDRYGHLFPGSLVELAGSLDNYMHSELAKVAA